MLADIPHRKSQDQNFKGIEKAKAVAREDLGLPKDFVLEHIRDEEGEFSIINESQQDFPHTAILFQVYIVR